MHTYTNFEFIILDDGSTDNTYKLISQYTDPRIILMGDSNNVGNYKRRNEGCKLAKGKYICVMDGDDIAVPNRLEKQVEIMEANPHLLALGSDFRWINGGIYKKPKTYDIIKIMLLSNNMFLHPSLIIRRDILEKVNYYNEEYYFSSDYDLMCKIALLGEVDNIDDCLMFYRAHQKQISTKHHVKQETYANQIRLKYAEACGFILSEAQKDTLTKLMSQRYDNGDIEAIKSLIDILKSQNKEREIYDNKLFNEFLKRYSIQNIEKMHN